MLVALLACQPSRSPPPADAECPQLPPAPGEVRYGWIRCDDQIPQFGEARQGADALVETSAFRAVVHDPVAAMTLPDLGGGTLLDLAAWGEADLVHEVVPIVGGGWLTGAELHVYGDRIEVSGTVAPILDRPAPAAGERRTVTYRADPDAPWLAVDGADGFWVQPGGDERLYGGFATQDRRVIGADGVVEDLGGAYVVTGSDRLLVGAAADAWSAIAGADGTRVTGTAVGAQTLVLYDDGVVVGRVSVGEDLDLTVPANVDAVRVEAPGRTPSLTVPPGEDLDLGVGATAGLTLVPTWSDERPHYVRLDYTAADGRAGGLAGVEGTEFVLGAGSYDLEVSAGPAFEPWAGHAELGPDEHRDLEIALVPRLDPDRFVVGRFRLPQDRSRDWRGSDLTALATAAVDGVSYATFCAEDDVGGSAGSLEDEPPLRARVGLVHHGDGWSIAAWPWTASSKKPLHGGPQFWTGDPRDDAALMWGGPDDSRTLHVDLGWLDAVDPTDADPLPDLVALESPGPDLAGFAPWFRWLDAHRYVIPTGPVTWIAVDDPADPGLADIEQGLNRGEVTAGTGPLLLLTVDDLPPGATLLDPRDRVHVVLELRNPGTADRLALVVDGDVRRLPAGQTTLDARVAAPERWIAAAALSPDGVDWAVTMPVWQPPSPGPTTTTTTTPSR